MESTEIIAKDITKMITLTSGTRKIFDIRCTLYVPQLRPNRLLLGKMVESTTAERNGWKDGIDVQEQHDPIGTMNDGVASDDETLQL